MKIKISQLKQIIKEEVSRHLNEVYDECPCGIDRNMCDYHKPQNGKNEPSNEFVPGQRVKVIEVIRFWRRKHDPEPPSVVGFTGEVLNVDKMPGELDLVRVKLEDGYICDFANIELEAI